MEGISVPCQAVENEVLKKNVKDFLDLSTNEKYHDVYQKTDEVYEPY